MWRIETLAEQPGRDEFDCGDIEINEWLQLYARQSDRRNQTLTRVALHPDDGRIVGYYATKAYQLEGAELRAALGGRAKYPVPCMLIVKLGSCLSVRGEGVGELLLLHALRSSVSVSESMGLQFAVVHSKNERSTSFYAKYGFAQFVDHPNHLLIPTRTLRKLFK